MDALSKTTFICEKPGCTTNLVMVLRNQFPSGTMVEAFLADYGWDDPEQRGVWHCPDCLEPGGLYRDQVEELEDSVYRARNDVEALTSALPHAFRKKSVEELRADAEAIAKRKNGFVLPAAIFVVALLSLLAVTALPTTRDSWHAANNTWAALRAQYNAEAGLATEVMAGAPCMPPGDTVTYADTLTGAGSYTVTIIRLAQDTMWAPPGLANGRNCILPDPVLWGGVAPRVYVVQSEGRYLDARAIARATVYADSAHTTFTPVRY